MRENQTQGDNFYSLKKTTVKMIKCPKGRVAPDNQTFYDIHGYEAYCPEVVNFTL